MKANIGRQHVSDNDGHCPEIVQLRSRDVGEAKSMKMYFLVQYIPSSKFKNPKHLHKIRKSGSSYCMILETLGYIFFPIHHQSLQSNKLCSTPRIPVTSLIDANQQECRYKADS